MPYRSKIDSDVVSFTGVNRLATLGWTEAISDVLSSSTPWTTLAPQSALSRVTTHWNNSNT